MNPISFLRTQISYLLSRSASWGTSLLEKAITAMKPSAIAVSSSPSLVGRVAAQTSEIVTFSHPDPLKAADYRYSVRKADLEAAVAEAKREGESLLWHAKENNPFCFVEKRVGGVWNKIIGAELESYSRSFVACPNGSCYFTFNRKEEGKDQPLGEGTSKVVTDAVMINLHLGEENARVEIEECVSASMVTGVEVNGLPSSWRPIHSKAIDPQSTENELAGLLSHRDIPGLMQAYDVVHYSSKTKRGKGVDGTTRNYKLIKTRIFLPRFTGDLDKLLQQGRCPGPAAKINIALRLLRTIAALHRKGIIHRDLKLGNICIRGADLSEAKVGDMGHACSISDEKQRACLRGTICFWPFESILVNIAYSEAKKKVDSLKEQMNSLKEWFKKKFRQSELAIKQEKQQEFKLATAQLKKAQLELVGAREGRIATADFPCDVWQLGIIFYYLFGTEPSKTAPLLPWKPEAIGDPNDSEAYLEAYNNYLRLHGLSKPPADFIADQLRQQYSPLIAEAISSLINSMLNFSPAGRSSVEQALENFQRQLDMLPKHAPPKSKEI